MKSQIIDFECSIRALMLLPSLTIYFIASLLVTTSAVPTERNPIVSTGNAVDSSNFTPPTLPTVTLAKNLSTPRMWRPRCWPDDPGMDPMGKANPITDRADCPQAIMNMLTEGPPDEMLVWDTTRTWIYNSCGVFLLESPGLPIHRATFTRTEIAQCAERIRIACVNEKHGYRGGIIPIDAGVFQVAVSGKPVRLSWAERGEGIGSNATALDQ